MAKTEEPWRKSTPEELRAYWEKLLEKDRMELTAIARRWGSAQWVFNVPEPLWQVQIHHRAAGPAEWRMGLIETLRRVLSARRHPSFPEVYDFKTLLKESKVKVLNGAPPPDVTPEDPDNLGMELWRPVIYVAGAAPFEALTVIRLILEEKVRKELLPSLPSLHLVWALLPGETVPQEQLPELWTSALAQDWWFPVSRAPGWPSPFSSLPPWGRRHALAHLERAAKRKRAASGTTLYDLKVFGGTYHFKDALDRLKVPVSKMVVPSHGGADYVRVLRSLEDNAGIRAYIQNVLGEALYGVPVLLFNDVDDEQDPFALWLLEQPSIILRRPDI